MNKFDKVVVKNGVDADVTVTLGLYNGQVSEINAQLATISPLRGKGTYNVDSGKPQFVWSGVDDNELWIYTNGIAAKANGINTVEADQSIRVIPYNEDTTYVLDATDFNKILVVNDLSVLSYINVGALTDEKSFILQNDRTVSIYVTKIIGMTGFAYEIFPNEMVVVKKLTGVSKPKFFFITGPDLAKRNLSVTTATNITMDESSYHDYLPIRFVLNGGGSTEVFITQFGSIGRDIKFVPHLPLYSTVTINLPSGETFLSGGSSITFSGPKTVFKTDGDSWAFY